MHILIGLLLAFVLIAIFSNRKTRGCRWRLDRARNENGQQFHICMACGAQCFTKDSTAPKTCLRPDPKEGDEEENAK